MNLTKHKILKGEDHPQAKLTERDVKAIRTYSKGGFKQQELAEMFNVKRNTISAIITRKSWRHVE
jgi:uncharacterized protein YjcR